MLLPKIYPITDTKLSRISHFEQVRSLLAGGAQLIQIRDKHLSSRELFRVIEECMVLVNEHDATIILNDRADIAKDLGTGVHLGQDDLPPVEARKLLGPGSIIGFSTHSVEQAVEAIKLPVDYIAAGPIFSTGSKPDHEPVIGLKGLEEVRAAVGDFPLVAIGGIGLENYREVLSAGADSVAMISALVSDPGKVAELMSRALEIAEN